MVEFTTTELEAAQKAVLSTIRKTEKVRETLSQKQPPRTSQLALVSQKLRGFYIASSLIARGLNEDISTDYTEADLEEAARTIPLLIQQIEEMVPKFKEGTSQHTLAIRRIKAFQISSMLIDTEMSV